MMVSDDGDRGTIQVMGELSQRPINAEAFTFSGYRRTGAEESKDLSCASAARRSGVGDTACFPTWRARCFASSPARVALSAAFRAEVRGDPAHSLRSYTRPPVKTYVTGREILMLVYSPLLCSIVTLFDLFHCPIV